MEEHENKVPARNYKIWEEFKELLPKLTMLMPVPPECRVMHQYIVRLYLELHPQHPMPNPRIQPEDRFCLKADGRFITVDAVNGMNGDCLVFTFDDGKDAPNEWPLDDFIKRTVRCE